MRQIPKLKIEPYNFKDKPLAIGQYVYYMLNRTQGVFKWNGLPQTIPQRYIELYCQCHGFAGIAKYKDDLYVFFGGLGGEPDEYYEPTIFTVSNPGLDNFSANLKIDEECVIIKNDTLYMGLLPLFRKYATLLSENDLTIKICDINSRLASVISAQDDRTQKSAEKMLNDLEKGDLGIVGDSAFLEGVKAQPYGGNSQQLSNLIELNQYLQGRWLNEIGLQANWNGKREAVGTQELEANDDALTPLISEMLRCRQEACEKINKLFGTNISVELNGPWLEKEKAEEAEIAQVEEIIENPEEEKKEDIVKEEVEDEQQQ